tara:strand:- start:75 stop:443 length:369 start_codon:yes stop_codon:yes gene_type:complete
MSSISLRTPIVYDSADGFGMIKTLPQLVRQNLKMLILTNPGERVMDPDFGVGIQRYLFSNFSENYQSKITNKINEQVSLYMPGLIVQDIQFHSLNPDTNSAAFRIVYYLPNIGTSDLLEITI